MSRWKSLLWRAVIALGEADPTVDLAHPAWVQEAVRRRHSPVDLFDDRSVGVAFQAIVEREWGPDAGGDPPPRHRRR